MQELWRAREALRDDPLYMGAFAEAWRKGRAHAFVLDLGQQEWIRRRESSPDFSVWMISRQRGKSFAALFDDLMYGNRTPGAICRYLGQTGDSALAILGPTMDQIMAICPLPKRERPYPYNTRDSLGSSSEFRWDNGASFVWSGTDNDTFRRQRGPKSHRITYDEAAFYPKLREVTETLNPTLTRTGGSPLYLSTPPITPDHMFAELYEAAAKIGRAEHETLYQNPQLTHEQIEAVIEKAAQERGVGVETFKKSTYFRREYLAEICLDSELAVVPEFPEVREEIVAAGEAAVRPPFFDLYGAGDPGVDDHFGFLFGYHDFRRSRFVIEYELLLQKANSKTFAEAYQRILAEHYPHPQEDPRSMRVVTSDNAFNVLKPHSSVLDTTVAKAICQDLFAYHGLTFSPAVTYDRESRFNAMRLAIASKRVEIHPRCEHLIRQLGTATRKAPGEDMVRSKTQGHFDLVSSLSYLLPTVDWARNPFPADFGFNPKTMTRRVVLQARPSLGESLLRGTSLGRKR